MKYLPILALFFSFSTFAYNLPPEGDEYEEDEWVLVCLYKDNGFIALEVDRSLSDTCLPVFLQEHIKHIDAQNSLVEPSLKQNVILPHDEECVLSLEMELVRRGTGD